MPFGTLHDVVGLSGGVGFEYLYRLPFAPVLLLGFNGELWQHSTNANALNSDLAGHLIVRFQRPAGSVRPYADAIIGLDYIQAHLKDVEPAVLETRTLGLGIGGGLTRRLSETHSLSIDLRARFRYASPADMLSAGLVRPNVRTTMFTLYFGFSMGL